MPFLHLFELAVSPALFLKNFVRISVRIFWSTSEEFKCHLKNSNHRNCMKKKISTVSRLYFIICLMFNLSNQNFADESGILLDFFYKNSDRKTLFLEPSAKKIEDIYCKTNINLLRADLYP